MEAFIRGSQDAVGVRAAEPSEAGVIVGFQIALARESEGMVLDLPTVRRGVAAVFADPALGRYWMAELGGQVVGCCLTLPEWSDWRNGTVLWIHSVYVLPTFRRLGVFRAIYAHLRGMVEANDSLRGLRLFVERNNLNAQATYRSLGMSDEHYRLFEWLKDG